MKKLAFLMAVILSIMMVFTGCSKNNGSTSMKDQDTPTQTQDGAITDKLTEKPNVRVWIKKSFSAEADNALIERLEDYGKKTGTCDVTVEMIPNANFGEKYSVAVESGEVPDVAYMTLYLLRQYYDADLLLDTEDLLSEIESSGHKLSTQSKAAATFNGKVYAIPYYLSSTALLYRKDYLKAAGWDKAPETWEKLRQCAKDVTEKVPNVYGIGFTYLLRHLRAHYFPRELPLRCYLYHL
ncbi:MAG TPA: extracellular solute-binding protein [Clostridiales bacterium]|nr:extracellular solute-binding protein [Clostridiales bacterium]